MEKYLIPLLIAFIFSVSFIFLVIGIKTYFHRKAVNKLKAIIDQQEVYSLKRIKWLKENSNDFAGIYVLYNIPFKKYYVGQSIHVYQRILNHFQGKGCEGVFRDYSEKNCHFNIRFLPLDASGYSSLNKLEKNAIEAYEGFTKGYNKTRGNA